MNVLSLLSGCPGGSPRAAQHQPSLPCQRSRARAPLRARAGEQGRPAETPILICSLILHLDTQSEEQTLPFPVPLERSQLRRMSPFSSTLNLQPSFSGRSYFELRSSAHQLSLHSSLQSLNSAGELSTSGVASWSVLLGISKLSVCSVPLCLFFP